jgi:hypothetical protein
MLGYLFRLVIYIYFIYFYKPQALSNEIGDSTIMQAVLSSTGSSNYRGRAQHILILQKKVNELQAKLNKVRGESNDSIKQDAENSNGTYLIFY